MCCVGMSKLSETAAGDYLQPSDFCIHTNTPHQPPAQQREAAKAASAAAAEAAAVAAAAKALEEEYEAALPDDVKERVAKAVERELVSGEIGGGVVVVKAESF